MASYLYAANVSPQDRFDQIQIQLDNGSTGTLVMGQAYDLSPAEFARAARFIVLTPSSGGSLPSGGGSVSGGSLLVTAPAGTLPSAVGLSVDTLWVRRRT
jgi:hypothetical protein